MKLFVTILLLSAWASATSYTVKSSGGNFTTISACAATAVAGDTCTVFASASPQAGWTQGVSGSSGNPITFTVNTGDAVTINSGVTISSQSWIVINGFNFSGAGITGNGSSTHNTISNNTANTTLGRINDGLGSGGSDNVFSGNTITFTSTATNAMGFYVYGDRNRFENNTISGGGGDCFDLGGANVVVRGNYCHDMDGSTSGEHIDFIQVVGGGTVPTLSFSLVENNIIQHNTNQSHAIIVRTGGSGTCPGSWSAGNLADTVIYRFNYAQNLVGGSGASFGGVGDCVPNSAFYNNTIATEQVPGGGSGDCSSYQNAPTSLAVNNICYNTGTAGSFPIGGYNGCGISGLTGTGNGNLAFSSGYSGSWAGPYCGEATYAALHNQNPSFANYPTNDSLNSSSPAIGAGVALTTASGSGVSSTSLTMVNCHGFQPGWAGATADWIRIGASTTVQISAINYSTCVVTLASAVSWSNGDSIYLYKNSSGTQVLVGSLPNVGAGFVNIGFTISPSTIPANHPTNITLTLTGTNTAWNGSTAFSVSGVSGLTLVSCSNTSATAETCTVTTGAGTGTATLTDTTDSISSTFQVAQAATPTCDHTTGTYFGSFSNKCSTSTTGTVILCWATGATTPVTAGDGATCSVGTPLANNGSTTVSTSETFNIIAGVNGGQDSSLQTYVYTISAQTQSGTLFNGAVFSNSAVLQ